MPVEAVVLDIDGTLIESNYQHALTGGWSKQQLREAGAAAVFESADELRRRLDETLLG